MASLQSGQLTSAMCTLSSRESVTCDLVISQDDISHGLRFRAEHLVTLELGPRTDLGGFIKEYFSAAAGEGPSSSKPRTASPGI